MKKVLFYVILVSIFTVGIYSCGDEELAPFVPELSVQPDSIHATVEGGVYFITVTGNSKWNAVVDEGSKDWCIISPPGEGNGSITVVVKSNDVENSIDRKATITVNTGELKKQVVVVQPGSEPFVPELSIQPDSIHATIEGGLYFIAVTGNGKWTAIVDEESKSWCTVSPQGEGNGSITVAIKPNATDIEYSVKRKASITVNTGELQKQVVVVQSGLFDEVYIDENFDSPDALDNWAVVYKSGHVGDITVNEGNFVIPTEGGSDVYAGVSAGESADEIFLSPDYKNKSYSFENVQYELSIKENYIIPINNNKDMSCMNILFVNAKTNQGVYIGFRGRYQGYSPIDNTYDTFHQHVFDIYSDLIPYYRYSILEDLNLESYYTYKIIVTRNQGEWTLNYKENNQKAWKTVDITRYFGNNKNDEYIPQIRIVTGDGGYTRQTAKASMSIDYFRILK